MCDLPAATMPCDSNPRSLYRFLIKILRLCTENTEVCYQLHSRAVLTQTYNGVEPRTLRLAQDTGCLCWCAHWMTCAIM